jgi:uncharacterized protein YjbI with pentapeptide repeats
MNQEIDKTYESWRNAINASDKEQYFEDYSFAMYKLLSEGQDKWKRAQGDEKEKIRLEIEVNISQFDVLRKREADEHNGRPLPIQFRKRNFQKYYLPGVNLAFADCSNANFMEANLIKADFSGADCCSAIFNSAKCIQTDFFYAKCPWAQFMWADCSQAQFPSVNCTSANFNGANCTGVNFGQTNMEDVEFWQTNLREADFRWSSLSKAKFYDTTNISGIKLFKCSLTLSTLVQAQKQLFSNHYTIIFCPEENEEDIQQACDVYLRLSEYFESQGEYEKALAFKRKERAINRKLEEDSGDKLIRIFISYSRIDKNLMNELAPHLELTEYKGKIKVWYDKGIEAGIEWDKEIKENLEMADIILLLVSKSYLESEYISNVELKYANECIKTKKARVVPVILEDINMKNMPFKQIQVLPEDALPVMRWNDRNEAWKSVAKEIMNTAESVRKQRN